jgi:hypothetical protein
MTDDRLALLKLVGICRAICGYNRQDAVLVQDAEVVARLITPANVQVL